jgi:hypothetical protein
MIESYKYSSRSTRIPTKLKKLLGKNGMGLPSTVGIPLSTITLDERDHDHISIHRP